MIAALWCSTSVYSESRPFRTLFGLASVGGNMPISGTASPADAGLQGSLAFGLSPLSSTPEIAIAVRGSYGWFFSGSPVRWVRSLQMIGGDFIFYPNPEQSRRWYLLAGAGIARADQHFAKVNDPYGCIGVGAEIGRWSGFNYQVEVRLTDLSNSTYGDLRFLTVAVAIKI